MIPEVPVGECRNREEKEGNVEYVKEQLTLMGN